MNNIDLEKFRLSSVGLHVGSEMKSPLRQRQVGKFLRGPIPWGWLSAAAQLPGRALHVGTAIWFLRYLHKSETIKLSAKVLRDLGVTRQSGYRNLRALEAAGLVSCVRAPGRCPVVTILSAPAAINGNGNDCDVEGVS